MEKETVRNLAFETSHQTYALSAAMINLEAIQGAVSQLMERIDEITYKKWDEDPGMARLSIREIKDTVRLIDMAFNPLFCSLNEDVKKLENHSNELFNIIVKQGEAEKELETTCQWMSPERDREMSLENNRQAFFNEFGRVPDNDEEVKVWISGLLAKIDESEQIKKAFQSRQ